MADPLNARRLALRVLKAVLERGLTLEQASADHIPDRQDQDHVFAHAMVRTTLWHLGRIDAVIATCLRQPLRPGLEAVRHVLRLGVAQVLCMSVPPHAAVDTSVRVLPAKLAPFRGLVNGVLRRVAREGAGLLPEDPAWADVAPWLQSSWVEAYGEKVARAMAHALDQEPAVDLTVVDDAQGWAARLGGTMLPTGSVRLPPGTDVRSLPGFADGAWWVQDAAAALPVRLLGDVRGLHVLDLAAAPGGKTAQLVYAGARVTAVDRSAARLAVLHENLSRLRMSDRVTVLQQAIESIRVEDSVDAILLDAPCSATGTLRRHRDLGWIRSAHDGEALAAQQAALLDHAASLLKPGGRMVYAVCSVQPDEGRHHAVRVAEGHPLLTLQPLSAAALGLPEAWIQAGCLQTLPHHMSPVGGVDGFFAMVLTRKA